MPFYREYYTIKIRINEEKPGGMNKIRKYQLSLKHGVRLGVFDCVNFF
jgi:hypothetical protein